MWHIFIHRQALVPLLMAIFLSFGLAPEDSSLSMDFPQETPLSTLVAVLARDFDKNFIIDPSLSAKVQIYAPHNLSKEDAYQIFLSALNYAGYTTIETGRVIKVVKVSEGQRKENPLIRNASKLGASDRVVTYFYALEFLDAREALPPLKRLATANAVMISPSGNGLIFTDSGIKIQRLLKILAVLDVKTEGVQIEVILPRTLTAEELSKQLRELFKPIPGVNAAALKLQMAVEPINNALVLFGGKSELLRARDFIAQIDQLPPNRDAEGKLFVRPIEFANAAKLAAVLQALSFAERSASVLTASKAAEGDQHKILVDEDTNSLLIKGNRPYYQAVDRVIQKLDKQRALIYYSVEILEISSTHNLSFGSAFLQGGALNPGGSNNLRWLNSWQFPQVGPFLPQVLAANPAANAAAIGAGTRDGVTIAALGSDGVVVPGIGSLSPAALIQMLKTDETTSILSSPRILSLDNEEASITVGETLFFKSGLKDARGNTADKVTKEPVDLQLTLKGHAIRHNQLSLELNFSAHTVNGLSPDQLPTLAKRTFKQKVMLNDLQTMVLVGFERRQATNSVSRVPLLGDIPLLGLLFRRQFTEEGSSQLAVFMTAGIISKASDFEKISQRFSLNTTFLSKD